MRLYDTLSGSVDALRPLQAGHFGMYVCGMTPYDHCHIGHARAFLAFDVLLRHLRASGLQVNYVRNITDVDDRIIDRAGESGLQAQQLVATMTDSMHADFAALGMLPPTLEPTATGHIDEIVVLIEQLIAAELAYATAGGDVYFRVGSWPDYGQLSGRQGEEAAASEHSRQSSTEDSGKEDVRDFALWKSAVDVDRTVGAVWDSRWGQGRPGWHIECSAMSLRHLGREFDLHGGGLDLLFPHHENELAQSTGAGCAFARRWMHVAPLRMGADKMSKSLGNCLSITAALEQWPAEAVRFALLSAHYRTPLEYDSQRVKEAVAVLDRWYGVLEQAGEQTQAPQDTGERADFEAAMGEDLNVPLALAALHALVRRAGKSSAATAAGLACELRDLANRLGLLMQTPEVWFRASAAGDLSDEQVAEQVEQRRIAREQGDYAAADRIRDGLAQRGVELLDSEAGTRWRRRRDG